MTNLRHCFCVVIPSAITLATLIAMLVTGLTGVTDKNLYVFHIDTTNFSISSDINYLIQPQSRPPIKPRNFTCRKRDDRFGLGLKTNVTAIDLGLAEKYDIGLWGYCYTPYNGPRECSKPAYNWAETQLNLTEDIPKTLVTPAGKNVTVPYHVSSHIIWFSQTARWTTNVFIISFIALSVDLFCGIFINRSRISPCTMFLIAGIAAGAVCTVALLMIVMSFHAGGLDAIAGWYSVKVDLNAQCLIIVRIGAALAITVGLFRLFAICCCLPNRHDKSTTRSSRKHKGRR